MSIGYIREVLVIVVPRAILATKAMLEMRKIDLALLESAYLGN